MIPLRRRLWRSATLLAGLVMIWFLWLVLADVSAPPVYRSPWGVLTASDRLPPPRP